MSSHFNLDNDEIPKPGEKDKRSFAQRFASWSKKLLAFYPTDMSNPQHRRLMNQARGRAVVVMGLLIYYGYQHPEYSFISAWYHGSDKPLAEQRYEKMSGGDSPGTKGQQRSVESIMQESYSSSLPKKN